MGIRLFGQNNTLTTNLYPIEVKILASAGFSYKTNPALVNPLDLENKAETLLENTRKLCSLSYLDRFLFQIGFGEVSRIWCLAEDLKVVAHDLKERSHPTIAGIKHTMRTTGNIFINLFFKLPFTTRNSYYYYGFYL